MESREANGRVSKEGASRLPAKADFAQMDLAYLDSATMHPISLEAKRRVESYLAARTFEGGGRGYYAGETERRVLERFALLINARPEEVCFVPNTTTAEHAIIASLDLAGRGRIVTDTLHFFGSFYLYHELGKRGTDVVWVQPRDGRIELEAIASAVNRGTRLVAVSMVSTINGFQCDLKQVCRIAHANDAFVYADIAHAAGCVPFDVKDCGVDFAACPTFKWLMGDFGIGFLYVRQDVLQRLKRTQFGYYQLASWRTPEFPVDPPTESARGYLPTADATGFFAMGTLAHAALVQLDWSIDYILGLGVREIERYRQPMLDRLKVELPRLGYPLLTPPETTGPLVVFAHSNPNARELEPRLAASKVKVALHRNRIRVSPSVFNDLADVDRLLDALS